MIAIAICVSVVVFCFTLYKLAKYEVDKKVNFEIYKLQVTIKMDNSVPEILDKLIKESIDDYLIIDFYHKKVQYIDNEIELEIHFQVSEYLYSKISETFLVKLETYYNKKQIPDIISNRIFIAVTEFVVQYNSEDRSK